MATEDSPVKTGKLNRHVPRSLGGRRHIRGLALPSKIRTAVLFDKEHLVIPVVALIGGAVVRPLGSDGWEYVPPEVLSAEPHLWDNRPVVPVHPLNGTSSANTPEILSTHAFGSIFNSRYSDNRLQVDAYVDKERALKVGRGADKVVDAALKAMSGESVSPVEISVGAYVSLVHAPGVSPSGEPYTYRWAAISPDHLALGLDGAEGACSVEMGCGALRAAERLVLTPMQDRRSKESKALILSSNLQELLETALQNMEPSAEWLYVHDVDDTYVYYQMDEEGSGGGTTYRRPYSATSEDELMVGGPRQQVVKQSSYVPVEMEETNLSSTDSCTCGKNETLVSGEGSEGKSSECSCSSKPSKPSKLSPPSPPSSPSELSTDTDTPAKDPSMNQKQKLIAGLVACAKSPYQDEQDKNLQAMDEETLNALCAAFGVKSDEQEQAPKVKGAEKVKAKSEEVTPLAVEEPTPVTPVATSTSTPAPDIVQLSREEHTQLTAMAAEYVAYREAQKSALVTSLTSSQETYTQEELQALDLAALRKLDALVRSATGQPQVTLSTPPAYIGQSYPLPSLTNAESSSTPKKAPTFDSWLKTCQEKEAARNGGAN